MSTRAVTLTACLALTLVCSGGARAQRFTDVAPELGVAFRHWDGRSGHYYFVETVASGGGWLDYDGDGDLDLYLINGAATPGGEVRAARNRLFEQRDGRFFDVTEAAGLGDEGYGMGFCVGDANGDGLLDVFVTNQGPDRLYLARGEGRFTELSGATSLTEDRWSVSCAFGDVDGDGDLDLYVSRYVDAPFTTNPICRDRARDLRRYCNPDRFDAQEDALYINRGNASFRDEAHLRGIDQGRLDRGLGIALVDLDADGDLDVFVANDSAPNRMYINDGSGHFSDRALVAGTALNAAGRTEAGMGVAVGDLEADGLPELIVSNFSLETDTFYRNLGGGLFEDVTDFNGLKAPSFEPLSWGIELFDGDNDGDLDLATANGHIMENIDRFVPGLTYAQPNQYLENRDGQFVDVTEQTGDGLRIAGVSRALAVGDWNDDGCLDLLITESNGPARLLDNDCPEDNHWLGVSLLGSGGAPAIGASVRLRQGEHLAQRWVRSGGSVMSQNDLRVHFGLGRSTAPVELEIRWPDGRVQRESTEVLDRYWTLTDSAGAAPPDRSSQSATSE